MVWCDDDTPIRKRRGSAGRPEVNPFPSPEVEEDFAVRGRKMLELYWNDDPKTKSNIRFSPKKSISKTAFWAFVYIYYRREKALKENLKGFMSAVVEHCGEQYSSDRASTGEKVGLFRETYFVFHSFIDETKDRAFQAKQEKYRQQYRFVILCWEGCLE